MITRPLWVLSCPYHRVDKLLSELANPNLHEIPPRSPSVWSSGSASIGTCAG